MGLLIKAVTVVDQNDRLYAWFQLRRVQDRSLALLEIGVPPTFNSPGYRTQFCTTVIVIEIMSYDF